MLVLLVAVIWFQARGSRSDSGASERVESAVEGEEEPIRLAVLPFESVGAPEREFFASGVADEITSLLTAVEGFSVTSNRATRRRD